MLGLKVLMLGSSPPILDPGVTNHYPVSWLGNIPWPTDGRWVQGRCFCPERTGNWEVRHGAADVAFPPDCSVRAETYCGLHVMFNYTKLFWAMGFAFPDLPNRLAAGEVAVFVVELDGRVVVHTEGARAERARLSQVVVPNYTSTWLTPILRRLKLPFIPWHDASDLVHQRNKEVLGADWQASQGGNGEGGQGGAGDDPSAELAQAVYRGRPGQLASPRLAD